MSNDGMNKRRKDRIEVTAWSVGILGALVAASIGIWQMVETRYQRTEELRWRQANLARELIDKMLADEQAGSALRMLDWEEQSHEYEIEVGRKEEINVNDVYSALQVNDSQKSPKDVYIRECFDQLFFHINQVERSLRIKVLQFDDVKFPLDYYSKLMLQQKMVFETYMNEYGDKEALTFFQRFEGWKSPQTPPQ